MTRALLFDLDDTLYAYAPCNEAALAAAHERLDRAAAVSPEAFRAVHDEVRAELAERLRGHAASHNRVLFFQEIVRRITGAARPALVLELFDLYWRVFLEHARPAPGARAVLEALAGDHALAIVSNHTTEVQLRKVRRLGFDDLFDVIVTSEDAGVEKPDPMIFHRALACLGADAGAAVMIGDDPRVDVAGARAVGLRTVRSTEFRPAAPGEPAADAVVRTIGELPAVL